MNLGAVLLTGLFAGGISCAAVQGGLLTGLVARQRGTTAGPARPDRRPASAKPAKKKQGKGSHAYRAHTREAPKPPRARLADDLAPVSGFLAGKLVSHTLLGLTLGALGGVVQLSVGVRAAAQILAGVLIVVFGLAQLGVRGFRAIRVEPPAVFTRFVRGQARSQSALAPAILGFSTILIPCGVTLSVQALALTSGSAWAGAATMAVFVLGTSPLFAALGYAARKAATAWSGRLSLATGLLVLAMGLYTLNGGLTLADSPLAATNLSQTLGLSAPPATASTVAVAAGRQTAVMTARTGDYSPANIRVVAGVPTTLLVRSDNADGCIRSLIVRGQEYLLPVNGDTRIDLGVLRPGELRYQCGMGMYGGRLTIVAANTQEAATR